MPADIAITRDRVQRILTDWLGSATIDREGEFVVPAGSSEVRVAVKDLKHPADDPWFKEDNTLVSVYCVIGSLLMSPELCQFVATTDYVFGHLLLVPTPDRPPTAKLVLGHRLLGEFLDPDELKHVVEVLALVANQLKQEVKDRFAAAQSVEAQQNSAPTG